jgi:hypothetical protein
VESKLGPLGTSATSGLLYLLRMIVTMEEFGGVKIGRGNRSTRRKPALSTTNPTWPDPGANPGHLGGKPATNCFSYGAAKT